MFLAAGVLCLVLLPGCETQGPAPGRAVEDASGERAASEGTAEQPTIAKGEPVAPAHGTAKPTGAPPKAEPAKTAPAGETVGRATEPFVRGGGSAAAQERPPGADAVERAFEKLVSYKDGDSREPLLLIERHAKRWPPSWRKTIETRLVDVLRNAKATTDAKRFACLALFRTGSRAAAADMAVLLADESLSDMVLQGFACTPYPEVDDALVKALGTIEDTRQVGVIRALGERGTREALPALRGLLASGNQDVVRAALDSLGRIEGLKAVAAALSEKDERARRAALGALASWPKAEAAGPLLDFARSATDKEERLLALKGYVRLVPLVGKGSEDALRRAQEAALEAARTPEEKRLIETAMEELRITGVRASTNSKCEVAKEGLKPGALVYTDRDYTYEVVPDALVGAAYVKTANEDKETSAQEHLTFTVSKPVTVHVGFDSRAEERPGWLKDWRDTGQSVQTSDCRLRLYSKPFPAGTVKLGGNEAPGARSHYVVIIGHGLGAPARAERMAATPAVFEADLEEMPAVFEADFEDGKLDRWEATDPKAWRIEEADGNNALSLFGKSKYAPEVRSPRNVNLVKDVNVGSFVLDLRMLSTTKDYGHRDLCVFFGHQDPTHFYYVHIANKSDAHANSIFIVDGRPRLSIAGTRTSGTRWDDRWHNVRLVRNVQTGVTGVYFDDMQKPIMTAQNTRFKWGRIGVGSFDDTGRFDELRIRGEPVEPPSRGEAGSGVRIIRLADTVRVEVDGKLFTEYHYKDADRPYFYPVIATTGVNITRHYPMEKGEGEATDHRHHRSLWYTHGDVNGHDFWSEGKGPKIIQTKLATSSGGGTGAIETESKWVSKDGKTVCTDARRHVIHDTAGQTPECRMIDFEITIRASHGKVVLGDTKEGSMAMRVAPTMRVKGKVAKGHIANSEGARGKEAWGKRAKWCDYYGPVGEGGKGGVVGIAIFDHPSNPRHPTWWHARDYGLCGANPFGISYFEGKPRGTGDLEIAAGDSVTFKYRVYIHPGDEKEGEVEKRYREYAGGRE